MKTKISRRYSTAFYDAAFKAGSLEAIITDSLMLINLLSANRRLRLFFKSPIIKIELKTKIVNELFKDKINRLCLDFIFLLIKHNRENLIKEIFEDFIALTKEEKGIVGINITTAIELNEEEKKKFTEVLEIYTKKKIEADFAVDSDIIGGFIANIEDSIFDASIKTQLSNLGKKLKSSNLNI